MDKLINSYEKFLREKASENTVLSYLGDLNKFCEEFSIKSNAQIKKINKSEIEEYISLLRNRGMANTSILRTIASLKKFFGFCERENIVKRNPMKNIEVAAQQRKLPNTLTFDEVEKILESPDISTLKGIRDKAMLELLYATGARASELINLKVSDISLKNEMVIIESKKRARFVPVGKVAAGCMMDYLKECRPKILQSEASDMLFLNFYGQPLTRQGLWKIIKQYIKKVGISENVTLQTIRHSFALHLLKNGADAQSVSEMLGFNGVESTKIYIDIMNNKIKEVYKNAHPRA